MDNLDKPLPIPDRYEIDLDDDVLIGPYYSLSICSDIIISIPSGIYITPKRKIMRSFFRRIIYRVYKITDKTVYLKRLK